MHIATCSLDMSASKSENGDAHRLDPELAVGAARAGRRCLPGSDFTCGREAPLPSKLCRT
jgi:hypothetical protein